MKNNFFYLFLFVIGFSACSGMGKKHIAGNFYLTNIDYIRHGWDISEEYESDSYIGVINPSIIAVGYDENYIIVKQHPHLDYNSYDKSRVRYYIIPLKYRIHEWHEYNRIGPLKEDEFMAKRKELNIPNDLDFSIIVEKIE